MLGSIRKIWGKSPQTNPYQSTAGSDAGALYLTRPIGMLSGHQDGFPHWMTIQASNWVKTLGSGTIATQNGNPTTLKMTTAATQDNVTSMQLSLDAGTTAWAGFNMSTNGIWLRTRLQFDDSTASALLFGIANVTTANLFGTGGSRGAIGSGVTDFVGFHKPNASQTLNGVVRKASTSTSQTLTNYALADATYLVIDVVIPDGSKEVSFYVTSGRNPVYTQTTVTNFPLTATNLALTVAIQTPAAAAKALTIQRITGWQEAA